MVSRSSAMVASLPAMMARSADDATPPAPPAAPTAPTPAAAADGAAAPPTPALPPPAGPPTAGGAGARVVPPALRHAEPGADVSMALPQPPPPPPPPLAAAAAPEGPAPRGRGALAGDSPMPRSPVVGLPAAAEATPVLGPPIVAFPWRTSSICERACMPVCVPAGAAPTATAVGALSGRSHHHRTPTFCCSCIRMYSMTPGLQLTMASTSAFFTSKCSRLNTLPA